jgi:hypothetical protein
LNARRRGLPENFEQRTYYGQLLNIFVITLPACPDFEPEPSTIVLVAIRVCEITEHDSLGMYFYDGMGRIDIVDLSCLQCLVGRVRLANGTWAVLDRSGDLERAYYIPGE